MKSSNLLGLVALAAGLSASGAEAAESKPRSGCDISVVFKTSKGEIDLSSYRRMQDWLDQTKEISSFQDVATRSKGRKLCIIVPSREEIRPVYAAVTLLVDRSFGGNAPVKVENRFGGLFERKPLSSWTFDSRRPPRNNGISERPALGNRN